MSQPGKDQPQTTPANGPGAASGGPVFVSYASQDALVANAVVEALERSGISCWIAPRDVVPGSLYADAIVGAISDAGVILVILSEHSVASSHVGREIERAASKRRRIIALRTDSAPLPRAFEYFLSESQWIDLNPDGPDAAASKLSAAIRCHLEPATAPSSRVDAAPAAARSPTAPARKPWMVAGGVAVLSLALAYLIADKFWLSRRALDPQAAVVGEKSIAVLPFTDMSEKKDQEYFSDGLSEELIDLLAKVPDVRVPARTSSFYFKGKQATIAEIAKALGVAHVLEGSVRRSGSTLRITAQLIRVDSGYHVWSETYDRKLDDIFKVQDQIAGAVVTALKASLLGGGVPRAAPTASTDAYTLYLQARSLWELGTQVDNQKAIDYLKRALQLDPTFATAWALLARAQSVAFSLYALGVDADAGREAHGATEQALKLDPNLSDAHLAKARVLFEVDWERAAADTAIKQALTLDPRNTEALRFGTFVAMSLLHNDEGISRAQSAVARDPLSAWNYQALGMAQWTLGRLTEAEASLRKAADLNPTGGYIHSELGWLLITRDHLPAGLTEIERETLPGVRVVARARALDRLGRTREANVNIAAAEKEFAGTQAVWIANFHAYRNDRDRAFAWVDRAVRQHDGMVPYYGVGWDLQKLKPDPRYIAMLASMKLAD